MCCKENDSSQPPFSMIFKPSLHNQTYLQTSEADAEVDNNTNSEDRQSECSSVTSPPLLHLEEENRQLQYYLECTNNELVSTRQQMSDLDARLLEVEEDRARLIKRVTGLFSKYKHLKKNFHMIDILLTI